MSTIITDIVNALAASPALATIVTSSILRRVAAALDSDPFNDVPDYGENSELLASGKESGLGQGVRRLQWCLPDDTTSSFTSPDAKPSGLSGWRALWRRIVVAVLHEQPNALASAGKDLHDMLTADPALAVEMCGELDQRNMLTAKIACLDACGMEGRTNGACPPFPFEQDVWWPLLQAFLAAAAKLLADDAVQASLDSSLVEASAKTFQLSEVTVLAVNKPLFPNALPWLTPSIVCLLARISLWCPVSVVPAILDVLGLLPSNVQQFAVRHTALCKDLPSAAAFADALEARCGTDVMSNQPWLRKTCGSVTLMSDADVGADGEHGTGDADITMKRLRFRTRVDALVVGMCGMWRMMPVTVPANVPKYQKDTRFARLGNCRKLKAMAVNDPDNLNKIKLANRRISEIVMGVPDGFLSDMLDRHLAESALDFVHRAETYDPSLSSREVFQASRNAWTCFTIQELFYQSQLGLNGGIFGYSMLYPYTDNFLDDENIPTKEKKDFQARFRRWLSGHRDPKPKDKTEQQIFDQIMFVEERYDRKNTPDAFNSLVAILDAQTASLSQQTEPGAPAPPLSMIEDISVYKGGTSVLADGFMGCAEQCSTIVELFSFQFGVVLQLIDDMQDVLVDQQANQHTIFTLAMVNGEAADAYFNKVLHLLNFTINPDFHTPDDTTEYLRRQVLNITYSTVIKNISRCKHLCTDQYIQEMEEYATIPFSSLVKVNSMRHVLEQLKLGRM